MARPAPKTQDAYLYDMLEAARLVGLYLSAILILPAISE